MYAMKMCMFNVSSESLSQCSNHNLTHQKVITYFPSTRAIIKSCLFSYPFQSPARRLSGCTVLLLPLVSYSPSLFQPCSAAAELGGWGVVRGIMDNWEMRSRISFLISLSLVLGKHTLASLETTFCHQYIFIKVSFTYEFNLYFLCTFCGAPKWHLLKNGVLASDLWELDPILFQDHLCDLRQ